MPAKEKFCGFENVISGNKKLIIDGAFNTAHSVVSAELSEDWTHITLTYQKPDIANFYIEVTETFPIVLPN